MYRSCLGWNIKVHFIHSNMAMLYSPSIFYQLPFPVVSGLVLLPFAQYLLQPLVFPWFSSNVLVTPCVHVKHKFEQDFGPSAYVRLAAQNNFTQPPYSWVLLVKNGPFEDWQVSLYHNYFSLIALALPFHDPPCQEIDWQLFTAWFLRFAREDWSYDLYRKLYIVTSDFTWTEKFLCRLPPTPDFLSYVPSNWGKPNLWTHPRTSSESSFPCR